MSATQNNQILNHLHAGNSITPLDALKLFGCFRLGARIYDLKQQGHSIESKPLRVGNKRVAIYSMLAND